MPRKPGPWLVAIAIVVIGTAFNLRERIAGKVLDWRFGQVLAPASYPKPRDTAEAMAQDLDYLARLPEVDRSFDAAARERFAASIAALRARAATLTAPEFVMGIARSLALAGNAHTNLDRRHWRGMLNSVPLRLEWFADGLYIVRAMNADLLGARVVAVDGFDVDRLVAESAPYFGGPPEHVRVSSPLIIESPDAMHVLHPEAPPDRLAMKIVDANGTERSVELPALASKDAASAVRPGFLLSPLASAHEAAGQWSSELSAQQDLPASLREPGKVFYSTTLAPGVLYMHLWEVRDRPPLYLDEAIDKALGDAAAPKWQRIILDLRFDAGGDYPDVYRAIARLPSRLAPDGKLVVLVDNTTFSAAIIVAALAKHFGGARTVIMGDKTGDRLTFWAEGNSIRLPNSKIDIQLATGYHDWAHGCREWRCFWPNMYYGVGVGSVDPDVKVGWKFEDYRRGVDTVLERAQR